MPPRPRQTPRILGFLPAAFALTPARAADRPADHAPYLDPTQPTEVRVADLLGRLTLEEKISLVHGDSKFSTPAIPRLQIPKRWFSDGPHGVREDTGPDTWLPMGHTDDFCTAMPVLIALAATWNPDLARSYGEVIGSEARKRGKQVLIGPGVNIQRTPLGGRNFEYLGEDPWLASRIAVNDIRGIQSQGVAACVKHFAANNQERDRMSVDVEMDERALREIYLPAFKAAVREGGVLCVMGAYNRFRGDFCCENDYLLNHVLKGDWGFRGAVISDWGAVHDTHAAVLHGLDLEMGTEFPYDQFHLAQPFLDGIRRGDFPVALLDDKVRRNLRVILATGAFDPPNPGSPSGAINTPEHQAVARRVAEESMVLLKNDNRALPLELGKISSIVVIGEDAVRLQCHLGGSARLKAFYEVSPLEGILRRVGPRANVTFSQGYSSRLTPDAPDSAILIAKAVRAARSADVVIVVAGLNLARAANYKALGLVQGEDEHFDAEEADRKDLGLPYHQDELIRSVVAANPKTVVVLVSAGAVEMGAWLDRVPAVLQAWYGGMEGGNALAGILFGDINPSGKLPCTFPVRLSDSPAHALGAYPGRDGVERYSEGLLVGYRWYDTRQVAPLFPFGHGLSYTRFGYSGLRIVREGDPSTTPAWTVRFDVTNIGDRAGAETAQVYVRELHPGVFRPFKELKGFSKVFLEPGEKRTLSVTLPIAALSFYSPGLAAWVADKGEFGVIVGSSSRDIRLQSPLRLERTTVLADRELGRQ